MKVLNCCVVCYREVHLSAMTKNDESVTPAIFLRLFQRHVNNFSLESTQIKVRCSALTFLPKGGSNEQIKFQACTRCSEMLSSFNCSYKDIKCAEMKANWVLQQLANVIRFADYAPARRAKFIQSVNELEFDTPINNDATKSISTFRQKLEHQCRIWSNNQLPRVVLVKPKGKLAAGNIIQYGDQKYEWIAPKETLLSTALKNLSSLQLIIYLALVDPTLQRNMVTCSKITRKIPDATKNSSKGKVENCVKRKKQYTKRKQQIKIFRCNICDQQCKSRSALQYHELAHSGPDGMKYSCRFCKKKFISEWNMNTHLRTHTKEKPFKCPVDRCSKRFNHLVGLRTHLQKYHKSYKYDRNLYRAKQMKRPFKCSVENCDMDFTQMRHLKYHMENCHNNSVDKEETQKVDINKNPQLKVHLKEAFGTSQTSYNQVTNDSGNSNVQVVQHCNKISNENCVKQKRKYAKREQQNKIYRCKHCEQVCKSGTALRYHELAHLGPEGMQFSCPFCERKFITKGNMESHLSVHTKEKPYKCPDDDCYKKFKRAIGLRKHLQNYHKTKTYATN